MPLRKTKQYQSIVRGVEKQRKESIVALMETNRILQKFKKKKKKLRLQVLCIRM